MFEFKINFFSRGKNFLEESRRLEDTLSSHGRVSSSSSGGIAEFIIRTDATEDELKKVVQTLRLDGEITLALLEDDHV